jgi:aspartate racemase
MEIIQRLERDDAEGIIMGCTEIPLMITADDCRLPMFNTTEIHALAAVEFALS